MNLPWMELVAAASVAMRWAHRARALGGAGAEGAPHMASLRDAPLGRFPEAWRRQMTLAARGLTSLGIPVAPLFDAMAPPPWPDIPRDGLDGLRRRLLAAADETEAVLEKDHGADPLAARFEAARSLPGRRRDGQHLTPAAVADLTLGLAGLPRGKQLLDPTCGTGSFLLRAAAWPGLAPETCLWGSDLDPLAVQLARINLARFPERSARLSVMDAFSLAPGVSLGGAPLPPPDVVVGNLPFVRLHHLDSTRNADLLTDLAHRWTVRDPALVRTDRGAVPRLRLGGHGDLYALLLFHLAEAIPPPARFSLLTSNAWLDDRYGEALRTLVCRHFRLRAVVESQCERWFPRAAVNTVILVADRHAQAIPSRRTDTPPHDPPPSEAGEAWDQAPCRFVSLHRPLVASARDGVTGPRRLARTLLEAIPEEGARVVEIPQAALSGSAGLTSSTTRDHPHGGIPPSGWSVHLRGSSIYRLLGEAPGILPAGVWLTIRRGVTTNGNAFFYPEGPLAEGIEAAYLLPVLRSPREGERSLLIRASDLAGRLFHCHRSEEELRALGHLGALAWIAHGRSLTTSRGRALPEALTHRPFYAIRPERHRVVFTKAIHNTHRHPLMDLPTALDQRLYGVSPRRPGELSSMSVGTLHLHGAFASDPASALVAAALNSAITALSAEIIGSTNLGEGALDLPVGRLHAALLVPDGRRLDPRGQQAILEAFASLARRPVGPISEEMTQPDRQALDSAWLAGLGLPQAWLPAVVEALVERVRIRLHRASAPRVDH